MMNTRANADKFKITVRTQKIPISFGNTKKHDGKE